MGQYFYSAFVSILLRNIIGSTLAALNLKHNFIASAIYSVKTVNRKYFR